MKGNGYLNWRKLPRLKRGSAVLSITLTLLPLAVAVSTPAVAGSARAAVTVSATVVPNCATRDRTVVCSKGVAPPQTMSVETSGGAAPSQDRPSTSRTDQGQVTVVTVNF